MWQLLVLGATAVIQHANPRVKPAGQRPTGRPATSPWLLNLLGRKPRKLAAVALANKMARIVWSMMTSGERGRGRGRGRLIARLPPVQGSREKMLIGRSDDLQNPCRVAAS